LRRRQGLLGSCAIGAINVLNQAKFGVYFYPWYNRQRWQEAPKNHVPIIGEYDSRDLEVIRWQADLIASCGFDYVTFEVVPLDDWCFDCCVETTDRMIPELAARNVGWSFLIDVNPPPYGPTRVQRILRALDYMRSRGWEEGSLETSSGCRRMFAFAPLPDEAEMILEAAGSYDWRFPIWLPHWGMVDEHFALNVHGPFKEGPEELGVSVFDFMRGRRFISFWESSRHTLCFDGFCSVIPGYDDALLCRDPQLAPQVKRHRGETLKAQFESAANNNAEQVLLYGWNEYFETTTIEPTEQYGMFYVELVRSLIVEAKAKRL
jgi:hypothetical protein